MIYLVVLILYCEGQNLSHCWYGFSALWITCHGYMLHVFNCHILISVLVLMISLSLSLSSSLPLSLSWFRSYCTGRFAPGSSHKGRERGRERRGEMQGQRFPSPLPSPFCSCTLSTQIILAADGGSTAPLQWDGGVVNYSSLFTNLWFSPGGAAVRWDLSRGSWWTVTQQSAGFHFNQTQQRVRFLLHSAYYLVWSVLFVLDWVKYIFECSIA